MRPGLGTCEGYEIAAIVSLSHYTPVSIRNRSAPTNAGLPNASTMNLWDTLGPAKESKVCFPIPTIGANMSPNGSSNMFGPDMTDPSFSCTVTGGGTVA